MLDAVAGVPLLLLATYRIGYTPPFGSCSFSTTLTLHSFSETETLAMAGQVLGTSQCPPELQTALIIINGQKVHQYQRSKSEPQATVKSPL